MLPESGEAVGCARRAEGTLAGRGSRCMIWRDEARTGRRRTARREIVVDRIVSKDRMPMRMSQ
jgi:hypothetical protein